MRNITLSLISAICFLLIASLTHAQDEPEGSVYVITTITVMTPDGGSMAELDSLNQLYLEKLVVPNDKIVSQESMMHYYGSDSRDLVVVTEYANWCDIEGSEDVMDDLAKAAWPDDAERKAFFQKWNSYFKMHSDEIYRGVGSGK